MTTIDDAPERDRAIPDLDWRGFPDDAIHDVFVAPSGRLARVRMGPDDGRRVILVPGVTGSKEDFVLLMPLLADAGFRVESYDIAGQYESAAAGPENCDPPRARYDYDLFVDDLVAVVGDREAPVHVLGYSFAGIVAQLAVTRYPEQFASLALLSTPPASGQVFRGVKRIGALSPYASPRTGASLMLWGIRNNLNRVPPRRLAFVRERFALTRRASVDDIIGLMMRAPDAASEIRTIGTPTLVAVGSRDLWPVEQHRSFARRLGAEIAVYDTGHSPSETAPHQLARDLLALYASADTGP